MAVTLEMNNKRLDEKVDTLDHFLKQMQFNNEVGYNQLTQ
jgi:hypothetical protein